MHKHNAYRCPLLVIIGHAANHKQAKSEGAHGRQPERDVQACRQIHEAVRIGV